MYLALLTTELPPKPNGIGDYTYFLGEALASQGHQITLLTGAGDFQTPTGCRLLTTAFTPSQGILDSLPPALATSQPDWLVIQYNPFMYARRGITPWLPLAIQKCKKMFPQLKIAIMAHELFVQPENWKFMVMHPFQKAQLWSLLQLVDVAFVSIEQWTKLIKSWIPNKPVVHLPVSTNIPLAVLADQDKPLLKHQLNLPEHALILGSFGSGHMGKMQGLLLNSLRKLREQNIPAYLLFIGSGGKAMQAVCPPDLQPFLITTGFLDTVQTSHYFQIIDLFLSPFLDGISTRRTSAICGFTHGLPVLSTYGHLSDSFWRDELADNLVAVADEAGFSQLVLRAAQEPAFRAKLSEAGLRLYPRYFTWEKITEKLLHTLNP